MIGFSQRIKQLSPAQWILLLWAALGIVYVACAWSPSSYGTALNDLEYSSKPFIGEPRSIRSDEWAVITPLTQALARNNFQETNADSLYKEKFKINYGLPIFDWGMVFKPAFWGYLILPPAHAYSLSYYLLFSFFVFGFYQLSRVLTFNPIESTAIALTLYFAGGVQFWWTSNAATFSYFPLIIYALHKIKSNIVWGIPFAWLICCWQFGNIYPPFTYALGLSILAWFFISGLYRDYSAKHYLIAFLGCLFSLLAVYMYFHGYIETMSSTSYPGVRNINGEAPFKFLLFGSHFIPSLLIGSNYNPLVYHLSSTPLNINICEIGVWSTLLPLVLIFFSKPSDKHPLEKKALVLFSAIFLVQIAWFMLPIPGELVKYIGLNKVSPMRMMIGIGASINLLSLYLLSRREVTLSNNRIVCFVLFLVFVLRVYKQDWDSFKTDFFALVVVSIFLLVCHAKNIHSRTCVILASLLFGFASFFSFNPVQSAEIIFNTSSINTARTESFKKEFNQKGYISDNFPGSVLNGIGYPAVSHVNTTPQLDFWRKIFPTLPKEQFDFIFNRYAHIKTHDEDSIIIASPDVIVIPKKCFNERVIMACSSYTYSPQ